MIRNGWSFVAIIISMSIAACIVYVPFMHVLVPAAPVYALSLLAPIVAGIFMIIYEVCRRFSRFHGYFGGVPEHSDDILHLVRTTTASLYGGTTQQ